MRRFEGTRTVGVTICVFFLLAFDSIGAEPREVSMRLEAGSFVSFQNEVARMQREVQRRMREAMPEVGATQPAARRN